MASKEEVEQFVDAPSETLSTELKAWFDPATTEGQSKLVKSCLAMRNHGGGLIAIGFCDKTTKPIALEEQLDVRVQFHPDVVQAMVSKFASEPFPVEVHFVEKGGATYPVISVAGGARVPVATRTEIKKGRDLLVRQNQVYVRSIHANGTFSSTEIPWQDWPDLMSRCFNAREADIGEFLRRHLGGPGSATRKEFSNALAEVDASQGSSDALPELEIPKVQPAPEALKGVPRLDELPRIVLEEGRGRFDRTVAQRKVALPVHGAFEAAAIVQGKIESHRPNEQFRNLLLGSNPRLTGWPMWIDSRNFDNSLSRPYVSEGAWEAAVLEPGIGWNSAIDFWRLSPNGHFYMYRALQDDLERTGRTPPPGTEIDFGMAILRLAEVVVVAQDFAKALKAPPDSSIAFGFRWSGLAGRKLSSWADPRRYLSLSRVARDDVANAETVIAVEASRTVLIEVVAKAVSPLFEAFEGFTIGLDVVGDFVTRLVEHRL